MMNRAVNILTTVLVLFSIIHGKVLLGQNNSPSLEFKWSNDFFFQTDRYFSNGFDLALHLPGLKEEGISRILIQPGYSSATRESITLTHHFFTPRNLFQPSVDLKDRPYASYLLIGQRKVSQDIFRNMLVESELQVGILGRTSGGKLIQNGIHSVLPGSEPSLGWDNQLNPDFAVNYRLYLEKGILSNGYLDVAMTGQARAGIPYSDLSFGVRAYLGRNVCPYQLTDTRSGWGITAGASGRLMGYNGTLQGGLFAQNVHELRTINRLLGTANAALVYTTRKFRIEAGAEWLTAEYPGGLMHRWGYVMVSIAL